MEQEVGGRRVDSDHRKLQGIGVVGHGDSISNRDDDLIRPGALLVVGYDDDPLTHRAVLTFDPVSATRPTPSAPSENGRGGRTA